MKTCTKCNEKKPEKEFCAKGGGRNGLAAICKKCKKEVDRVYRIKHREELNQRSALFYKKVTKKQILVEAKAMGIKYKTCKKCKDKVSPCSFDIKATICNKCYYKTKSHEEKLKIRQKVSRLKRYGLTLLAFGKIFRKQNGKCAICGIELLRENTMGIKIPNAYPRVDHCHNTGNVRGLLCGLCNLGLGAFGEDFETMGKAVTYLKKASK